MKITKLLIIITLPMFIFSQEKNQINKAERHKRMKSRKIAFISDQLNFTPDKAQVFWPIYNQYTSELNSIMDDKKKKLGPASKGPYIKPKVKAFEASFTID